MEESSGSGDEEVSTCGWKRPAGRCEPVARSCAECLNVAPTSGEECKLLSLSGMCVRADFSPGSEDAWAAPVISARNGSVIQMDLPSLFAASSDYCADDDSECSACLQGANATSDVCYGASGCVCLGACESEAWNATAALLLPAVLSEEPFNSSDCSVGTGSEDIGVTIDRNDGDRSWLDTLTSDNECLWVAQGDASASAVGSCRTPRSCYDCLNTPLASGTECTITPKGLCTTMDAYVFSSDYRLNASVHAPHFFPSSNTTYCEASDATCQACWYSPLFTAAFSGVRDPSAFCVGADGCVCVGFCESLSYNAVVVDMLCDADTGGESSAATDSDYSGSGIVSISAMTTDSLRLIALIVALCVSIPAVAIVWCGQRARRAARERARAWRNRPPANGPLLGLEGWKKFREELIAEEQRALQGDGESDEVTPSVSVTIELQRPMLVANVTPEQTDERDADEAERDQEETAGTKDETEYAPMTDSEEEQDERRRAP